MVSRTGRAVLAFASVLACASPAAGQTVEDRLALLADDNASGYLGPVTEGLGFALTAGIFDRPASLGTFGFDAGVRVAGARRPEDAGTFQAVLPGSVELDGVTYSAPYAPRGGSLTTPTALGEGSGVELEPTGDFEEALVARGLDPEDFVIRFPSGLDIGTVPFAILHFALGLGFGTEVTVRFVPEFEASRDVGAASAWGLGVKHTLTHWVMSPVDVAVTGAIQNVTVGDYLDGSAFQLGVMAGRGLGPLTLYGAASIRRASVDIEYDVDNPDDRPGLPPHGTRLGFSSRLDTAPSVAAGLRLQLLVMNLAGEYAWGDFDTFSLKVGVGLP